MKKHVVFIHGAGEGAYDEDRLLATSLQNTLGSTYKLHYLKMPEDDSATYEDWTAPIERELATIDDEVIMVGHSVGGSVLAKYLCEERINIAVTAMFLLAAPYWNGEGIWTWDEARLPENAAARLESIQRIALYHSRDDNIVPFAHLALYATSIPQADIRAVDGRGHQFGNDLADLAEDIRRGELTGH